MNEDLVGFAYGEDLEGVPPRSLGYRLLAPIPPAPWSAEVEALARRLQAAPYSDHWPPTDLFCSVLLADGRRLVAVARYGLADHTPSQRRGGLELIGVLAPGALEARSALVVYSWLVRRRDAVEDLHQLGGASSLAEVLASSEPPPAPTDPLPVLPVRLWQEGALLFAASTPADPDHRLRLLEQGAGATNWQWLPLVGPDFPLQTYAQRGPLVAWTPHFAGVALKLDRKAPETGVIRPHRPSRGLRWVALSLLVVLLSLLTANVWGLLDLRRQLRDLAAQPGPSSPVPERPASADGKLPRNEAGTEQLLAALKALLDRGGSREWQAERAALLARYERLARTDKALRVREDDNSAKLTIAMISVLSQRGADHIEETVRRALTDKGFSDRLIKAACELVHEQFTSDVRERP